MAVRHYFLGANTGGGFVSVYDEFCPPECGVFLWVLKGVYVPAWQIAYVDGTAPHVREVPFPAASGAYLDLGQFYRCEELIPKLPELMRLTERYRAHYARAYDELRQAKALHDELESVYNPHVDFDGVYKLAEDHIQKIKKSHCKPAENGVE